MKQTWTKPTHTLAADKKVAYVNARLIDPESGLDAKGALLTEGTTIADFGPDLFSDGVPEGIETVDCGGNILCPGLLDIQVHFREPGQEHKETLETGSKSAVAGGVTQVVCQPNTTPVIDSVITAEYIKNKARETAYNHIRVYAALTMDMKGEQLTEMNKLMETGIVVGFTDDGLPLMSSLLMRRALEYTKALNVPVAQHAEDIILSDGGCMNEGSVSTDLGVKGICNATEAIIVGRDILLAELTGGHAHVLHISTKESIDLVRAGKARGVSISAEACPHHFWLTDEAVREHQSLAKMNPPLRAEADRLAVIEGLKDGTIDCITTDHAPHDPDSKNQPLETAAFGIVGVETMLPLTLELVEQGHLSLIEALGKMTYQAADIIHAPSGRFKKGATADLTLFDPELSWTIKNDALSSKSKNSPFDGRKTKGRALRTVISGETVFTLA